MQIFNLWLAFATLGLSFTPSLDDSNRQDGKHQNVQDATCYVIVNGVDNKNQAAAWSGTGVCVAPGWVITNRHVVPGTDRTSESVRLVFRSGTPQEFTVEGEVFLYHADRDLALIRCAEHDLIGCVPLGSTSGLKPGDPVTTIGFPNGGYLAVNSRKKPSVSLMSYNVSALQFDDLGWVNWVEVGKEGIPGMSGSGVVDESGNIVGIHSNTTGQIGRAEPVEFVKELLGEAALEITWTPEIPSPNQEISITVVGKGPVKSLTEGTATIVAIQDSTLKPLKLNRDKTGCLTGTLQLPESLGEIAMGLTVCARTESGMEFQRTMRIGGEIPLAVTVNSVELFPTKANGKGWDAGNGLPDIKYKILIDGNEKMSVAKCAGTLVHAQLVEFKCHGDCRLTFEVTDDDIFRDDFAGRVSHTAKPGTSPLELSNGQIKKISVTIREVPFRWPIQR